MWWIFWPVLVFTATSSFGKAHEQIRTACNSYAGGSLQAPCASEPLRLEDVRRMSQRQVTARLNGAAVERFYWNAAGPDGAPAQHDFSVAIAEFDDQGNAWDGGQVAAVRQAVLETLERSTTALVIVFIHGWKNNCEACNGDLACFREALALLAASEKRLAATLKVPAREVLGVYIGWRGASARMEPAKEASFFDRKAAADRIGSRGGDVTSLLSWIDAATDGPAPAGDAPSPAGADRLRNMVAYVGHSFGADVLFGAVANALDSAIAASGSGRPAEPFGDVLVLVNPAFEASVYRRFAEYARQPWPAGQLPLMLTVQARNDWATHYTFPAGRAISTIAQASGGGAGYREMIDALGHHEAYYTHHLDRAPLPEPAMQTLQKLAAPAMAAPPSDVGELVEMMGERQPGETCGCNGIRASDQTLTALALSIGAAATSTPPGGLQIGSPLTGLASRMEPCTQAGHPPRLESPLLVIRADASIVDGHSDITRLEFFDFLANFIVRVDRLRDPATFARVGGASSPAAPPGPAAPPWAACR